MSAELLSPADLAERLGVTPESVRRWARAGKVQSIKVGGLVRIVWPAVEVGHPDLIREVAK